MKHVKLLSTLSMLAAASAANAGITSTWTLTNDYDFRGITQTAKDSAIQASLEYVVALALIYLAPNYFGCATTRK